MVEVDGCVFVLAFAIGLPLPSQTANQLFYTLGVGVDFMFPVRYEILIGLSLRPLLADFLLVLLNL